MPTLADWNVRILAEFRENAGYVAWSSPEEAAAGRPIPPHLPGFPDKGMPLILVHHVGAKTGKARISPLFYQPVGENWAVFGTHGGSPRDPAWYRNLMAHPRTVVEAGAGEIPVEARLAAGEERARIWAEQIALVPIFAEFETASGRQVPVVLLERR